MSFISHTFAFAIGAFAAHTFARAQERNAAEVLSTAADDEVNVGNGLDKSFDSDSLDDSVLGEEDPGALDGSIDAAQTKDGKFGGYGAPAGS